MPGLQSSIFKALDGHDFEFDGDACRVEVFGVYDEADHRWIQLALEGKRRQMLTLRLDAKEIPECALVSLATWMA